LFITRTSNSKNKRRRRKVKRAHRTLIERVEEIVEKARALCEFAEDENTQPSIPSSYLATP